MNPIAKWMSRSFHPLFSTQCAAAVRGKPVLVLLLLVCTTTALATNWNVQVGGSQLAFSPQTVVIQPDDTVTWINLGGRHNVTADNGLFRCANGCDGMGGNGAPSSLIWRASLRFDTPGRYGYFCEPHGQPGAGMYGTVIVASPIPPVSVPVDGASWLLLLGTALLASIGWRYRTSQALG